MKSNATFFPRGLQGFQHARCGVPFVKANRVTSSGSKPFRSNVRHGDWPCTEAQAAAQAAQAQAMMKMQMGMGMGGMGMMGMPTMGGMGMGMPGLRRGKRKPGSGPPELERTSLKRLGEDFAVTGFGRRAGIPVRGLRFWSRPFLS